MTEPLPITKTMYVPRIHQEPVKMRAYIRFANKAKIGPDAESLRKWIAHLIVEMEPGTGLIIVCAEDEVIYYVKDEDGDFKMLNAIPGSDTFIYSDVNIPISEFNDGDCVSLTLT